MSRKISHRKLKFSENERVLCYQGPLIYEAKCLQSEVRENDKHFYFVHYNGWNKHWDEWVNENRVLKFNDANINKQKELLKRFGAEKNKRAKVIKSGKIEKDMEKRKISEVLSDVPQAPIGPSCNLEPDKKKSCHTFIEEESVADISLKSHIIKVIIPCELKEKLVDDWDLISRQKLLYSLPARITVQKILRKYVEEVSFKASNNAFNLKEIVLGLQEYFNVMLGSHLLYKFERPQYGDILTKYPNLSASQIYGAFHFIRFFVKFDSILSSQSHLTETNIKLITFYVHDCLRFLKLHISKFFDVHEYETAPAEYHRRAMT